MKREMLFFVCALLSILSISYADDYYWNDSAGGELGDPTKWNPTGTPGVDDYVYFDLPNSYTVWLDDYYTHDKLIVEGSDLTLELNGYEYMLDTTNDYNQSIIIGDYNMSSLTLLGGSVICRDLFTGRNGGDSVGVLNLDGAYLSSYLDSNWHGFYFGTSGDSAVTLTNDAFLEHGHGQSGIYGTAEFLIDGENTEWYVDGFFQMAAYGNTNATLSDGSRTRIGYLEMGYGPRSSAVINMTGVSQNTELAIENWWDPIGLYLGMSGSGVINLRGSLAYVASSMAIGSEEGGSGELNIYDSSWVDIAGSLGVGGTPDEPGGRGLVYLYDDPANGEYADLYCTQEMGESMVIWPDGTIRMDGGTIFMEDDNSPLANPIILKGGRLEGWGHIYAEVQNESGTVMPGVTGLWKIWVLFYNYQQGPAGTLKIGIGGTSSEWDYSVLNVDNPNNGQVTLDGFLDVDLLAGFVPDYNDEFVIIEAQSVSGKFINAPSQVVFEGGRFDVVYTATQVKLTHFTAEPSCPAYPVMDYNKDCLVNLADFAVMAEQWLGCGLEPSSSCP
jgi:hypothetical protein